MKNQNIILDFSELTNNYSYSTESVYRHYFLRYPLLDSNVTNGIRVPFKITVTTLIA